MLEVALDGPGWRRIQNTIHVSTHRARNEMAAKPRRRAAPSRLPMVMWTMTPTASEMADGDADALPHGPARSSRSIRRR